MPDLVTTRTRALGATRGVIVVMEQDGGRGGLTRSSLGRQTGVACIYVIALEALALAIVLNFFLLGVVWSCTRPWAAAVLLSLALAGIVLCPTGNGAWRRPRPPRPFPAVATGERGRAARACACAGGTAVVPTACSRGSRTGRRDDGRPTFVSEAVRAEQGRPRPACLHCAPPPCLPCPVCACLMACRVVPAALARGCCASRSREALPARRPCPPPESDAGCHGCAVLLLILFLTSSLAVYLLYFRVSSPPFLLAFSTSHSRAALSFLTWVPRCRGVGWLAGRPFVGWLAGRPLVGWLAGRPFVGWLAGRPFVVQVMWRCSSSFGFRAGIDSQGIYFVRRACVCMTCM